MPCVLDGRADSLATVPASFVIPATGTSWLGGFDQVSFPPFSEARLSGQLSASFLLWFSRFYEVRYSWEDGLKSIDIINAKTGTREGNFL